MLGTVLSDLCVLSHLIIILTLWSKFCCHHSHLTDEETETQSCLAFKWQRFWRQAIWLHNPGSYHLLAEFLNSLSQTMYEQADFPQPPALHATCHFDDWRDVKEWLLWSPSLRFSDCKAEHSHNKGHLCSNLCWKRHMCSLENERSMKDCNLGDGRIY